MIKIILDTNFIIEIIKNKIDLMKELDRITESGYEILILDKTLDELKKIKTIEAKIALKLTEKIKKIKTEDTSYVDDILVKIQDKNTLIATQDKELKKRLKYRKIIIRNKSHLQIN